MFAKLAIIIVAIGLTACGLLAMRQARLQAAHELAQAQLRIAREDERLLTLHAQIAERITPERIEALATQAGLSADEETMLDEVSDEAAQNDSDRPAESPTAGDTP